VQYNKPHQLTCVRTCCAYVETASVHLGQSDGDMARQQEPYPIDLACHQALEPAVTRKRLQLTINTCKHLPNALSLPKFHHFDLF